MLLQVLLVVVLLVVYLYLRYGHQGRLIYKMPGPRRLPIVGNTWDLLKYSDNLFMLLCTLKQYGSISSMFAFNIRAVFLYSPENAEVILSTAKYIKKESPYTFLRPWLSQGLLTSNGGKWHHRRKLLTPSFHFDILKQFTRTFIDQTKSFLKVIQEETAKDQTDPVPLISNHTLKVMCETSLGISVKEQKSKASTYFRALHTFGESFMWRLSRAWCHFNFIYYFTPCRVVQDKAVAELHKFTNEVIDNRKALREKLNHLNVIDNAVDGKKTRMAMLDLLLENEREGKIDKNGVREEVDTFLFEGHDTTAMALSFFMLRIAHEQEIQTKIFEELQQIFDGSDREPTMQDFAEMKYLECCIKESLRLYPSVPMISRYLEEDVELDGYTIPRGTICSVCIFHIHRCEKNFPDPEKFIPERFLPENVHKRHRYSYIPFSAGPRNCIGQKFAILEMKTLISGVIRRFQIEPITKLEDIVFIPEIVLRVKEPYYVRFKIRNTV